VGAVNLLAIETATTACAIGVRAGEVEVVRVLDEHRRHTEVLAPGIERLLGEVGLTARALDRVVVDRGPGLFTGLRVGLATASALAQALGCELVGVTSLELLARGAQAQGIRGRLLAVVDARRGEIFVQRFDLAEEVVPVDQPSVARPSALVESLDREGPVTLVGDGAARYAGEFAGLPGVARDPARVPSLGAALELGAARPGAPVTPLYLREADAVANFVTRQRP
jgi:tRNA threonylcarbamoyl adenosine modification protein YeaZ